MSRGDPPGLDCQQGIYEIRNYKPTESGKFLEGGKTSAGLSEVTAYFLAPHFREGWQTQSQWRKRPLQRVRPQPLQ
jgi:hypothetical protein